MAIHDGDAGLIAMLARPGVHSGPDLGRRLGISRVAVKKRIDRLVAAGLPVESVAGRGYRLAAGVELLSRSGILAQLAAMSDGG
ncbi:MAG: HTH domain-containing protein, partial [Cellvibrionales bacterium]|nr:HTH domain-containing protein [Cellvibrionales bacterium]